jgi:hypothetical protein
MCLLELSLAHDVAGEINKGNVRSKRRASKQKHFELFVLLVAKRLPSVAQQRKRIEFIDFRLILE